MVTAVDLARAALQGFFDDPTGFSDMQGSPQRRKAVKEVERLLPQVLRDHEQRSRFGVLHSCDACGKEFVAPEPRPEDTNADVMCTHCHSIETALGKKSVGDVEIHVEPPKQES